MARMSTNKGNSTYKAGKERYQRYKACNNKMYYYYECTALGELFSCVAPTLEECRAKREIWLQMLINANREG